MKNLLSSLAIVVVLAALGLSTMVALPRGMDATAAPAQAPSIEVANAPAAVENYNVIAMPLDSAEQFTDAGLTFDADGLADLIGAGVKQVLRWDASQQIYEAWFPEFGEGVNFLLEVGGVYWVLLDSTAGNIVSFVGDVPAQGAVQYNLVGGTPCLYNNIMVPLDQSSIAVADDLANSIGNTEQVLRWDAQSQLFETRLPVFQEGPNFPVQIGYPYYVCLTQNTVWP